MIIVQSYKIYGNLNILLSTNENIKNKNYKTNKIMKNLMKMNAKIMSL